MLEVFISKLLVVLLLIETTTVRSQSHCPSVCRCYSHSAICSRQTLTAIPEIRNSFETLDLSNNRISYIRSRGFSHLTSLRTLYLNLNDLQTLNADSFTGLENLQELSLYGNKIDRIHSETFTHLRNLKKLYLQQNRLSRIEPGTFKGLFYLEKLFINNNLLASLKEDAFDVTRTSLKEVNLAGNRLDCDCDLFWLWKLAAQNNRSPKTELNAFCFYPANFKGKKLTSLTKSDFRCVDPVIVQAPRDVEIHIDEIDSYERRPLFECQAVGHPLPVIEWFRNGVKLDNSKYSFANGGANLIIHSLDTNDVGIYECVARSSVGEARASANFRIRDQYEFNSERNSQNNDDSFDSRESNSNSNSNSDSDQNQNSDQIQFIDMPNDLILNEGQNAKFSCRSNDPYSIITWLKDGESLPRNTNRFYVQTIGDLEIKSVRVEDEGFYVCSISNSYGTKYAQAQLEVNVPVSVIKSPVDQEVAEGNSVEFYCSVRGKPDPMIVWMKDDREIVKEHDESRSLPHYEFYQSNQLLRINGVKRQVDEGRYSCVANNSVNNVSFSASLTVLQSVSPYFTITQQNISVFEDHPITLECFANGDPKPQVLWYKNGLRIITDSRVYFDSFGYLVITQVRVSDAGEYLCRAENVAGFATHNFLMSVKDIYGTIISNTILNDAVEAARNDVKKQLQNTLNSLGTKRRPKTISDLLALLRFPKDKTLDLVLGEEIYERALDIIFRYANNITFNLTNQEYATQEVLTFRQLQRISDLSGCHRYKRKVDCTKRCLNYRTFDGTCNSINNARRGAANTALRRLLPAEYQNGFSTPRGWNKSILYHGHMLPSARDVSTRIISTKKITEDSRFSLMLMQWGQFLDHDLDHTVMAMSLNRFSNGLACKDSCTNDQPCFPIEIMENDTMRQHIPGTCMEFVRSSAVCGSGETSLLLHANINGTSKTPPKIHQREQINQLTAFIDASNVYGSNDQDAFDIRERTPDNGKLKVHVTPRYPKGLLPFNLDTNMDCQRDNTTTVGCFLAGDYRANEQLALLAMHNLWVRQHNTVVDGLKRVNPHWLPEQLYQEARKIVGAQMQFITYEVWLPYILGPKGMQMLGKFERYDENIDPTISNEFATAAFRFGHALIQPFTFRLNESFQPIVEGNLQLRDSFFAPQRYYHEGAMDPLMRGLYGMPAKLKMPREIMNSELTEKLFHITRLVSQDLASLNIQRSRDHGLPTYTAYRRYCNMPDVKDFDDLKEISSKEVRDILKRLYGDVRNIDIWPGGILEDVIEGSKLGPLFMCIIVNQFKVLRDGDRFWYEKPGVFSPAQLSEIKKTSLAKIICENGDNIEHIQRDVFLNAKFPRDMVRCREIRDISYEPWRNCCKSNPTGLCGESAYFYVPVESTRG